MNLNADKLKPHLDRQTLSRAYFVFGDEPLQALESVDLIRRAARAQGLEERIVFDVEKGFDWQQLHAGANEMSLFAARRLLEVRLGRSKPDKTGSAIIADLLARDDLEDVFLFTADALDRRAQQAKWFKVIDKAGTTVQTRQVRPGALPNWIQQRARGLDLNLTTAAAELIAVRAEGNLLAVAQELDKLALSVERGEVDAETVLEVTTDSARYTVFGLIDVILAGDASKAVRMIRGLREEGTEAVVIGWALNRELRSLTQIAAAVDAGKSMQAVFRDHHVWDMRAGIVKKALARNPLPQMTRLFNASIKLDRIVKGAAIGDAWDELEILSLALATGRSPLASRLRTANNAA